MGNLRITSLTYIGSPSRPDVEISGEWIGENDPPKVIKNFYLNMDDQLLQDIFYQTERSYTQQVAPVHVLHSQSPAAFAQGAGYHMVSYRLGDTTEASSTDLVLDWIFEPDTEEYTTWNLMSRMSR